ncbi:MAG: hypothetical protein HQK72_15520 [Desulfamplus sp.]|nr:hypothetical protein [Desulfamplus sp.]
MKLDTEDNSLTITLGEECTIIDVENHTDLLRAIPDNINTIFLNIDALKELDTAYLQSIYSLVKESQERSITIQTTGKSKVFAHLCKLYGVQRVAAFESQNKDSNTAETRSRASLSKKLSKNSKNTNKSKKQRAK